MYSINFSEKDKNSASIEDSNFIWNDSSAQIDIVKVPQGGYSLKVNNNSHYLHVEQVDFKNKTAVFNIDNKLVEVAIEEPIDLLLNKMGIKTGAKNKIDHIKAPMPGLVLNILVQEGDQISKGQPILVLEAMKMENVFKAPVDATIKAIKVNKGEAVEKGTIMLELM